MSEHRLIDRIRFAREGSSVERCHAFPHLMRYSVGHHTLDLITLLTLTWQEAHGGALPRSELLIAAAFHDIPERITGDLPSTTKRLPGIPEILDEIELKILSWLGVRTDLTDEEVQWLIVCDKIECILWVREEMYLRGNKAFEGWDQVNRDHAGDFPPVFHEVLEATGGKSHIPLGWTKYKEIAGL